MQLNSRPCHDRKLFFQADPSGEAYIGLGTLSQLHTCSSLRLCISTLTPESWHHLCLHSCVQVSGLLWSQLPSPAKFYFNFPELMLTLPQYISDFLPDVYQKNAISFFASFSLLFVLGWMLSTVLTSDPIWQNQCQNWALFACLILVFLLKLVL